MASIPCKKSLFSDIGNSGDFRNSFSDIGSAEFLILENLSNIASAPPFGIIPFSIYLYATYIFKVLNHLFITILTQFSITFLLNRLSFSVKIRSIHVYTQID